MKVSPFKILACIVILTIMIAAILILTQQPKIPSQPPGQTADVSGEPDIEQQAQQTVEQELEQSLGAEAGEDIESALLG